MQRFQLPFTILPAEFISLLKGHASQATNPEELFKVMRQNRALELILEKSFAEFNDGRGIEKVITALGWPNFRERLASVYIYKAVHGSYPGKTDMELVEDIKQLELRFQDHAVHSLPRIFLLGFYLKLANVERQGQSPVPFHELGLPEGIEEILALSEARSEKIDWLLLIIWHLVNAFGTKALTDALKRGKKFDDIYEEMETPDRELMNQNLLAYGASIQEDDIFLYEKV
jgi:hypothetical protein